MPWRIVAKSGRSELWFASKGEKWVMPHRGDRALLFEELEDAVAQLMVEEAEEHHNRHANPPWVLILQEVPWP